LRLDPQRRDGLLSRDRKFADLYGAFRVKRLFWVVLKFFVRSGKGRFSFFNRAAGGKRIFPT
jgi:hypothetical protein